MAPGTPGRDALEAVQLLRNTIHGEAMRPVDHHEGGRRRSLLDVPDRELGRLRHVLERRGGAARWGLEERGGRGYIDPELYLEAAVADAAVSLNALLEATDVRRLPGVGEADLDPAPVNVESGLSIMRRDPFAFENRRRIRVLAGLGDTLD